ncbi:STAS domain-containing protein [Heyndrickxia acidicola]|uniref:STAS domain-containing protein n=1 Tax=Heyndrickxia acidicola TaxID=209389 RepID=A0ABU6MG55_9BACI|nr:STAS domain-containing protein [Heyndrickxia acidicola]MED1203362.1 STAS domain-containing protein [Heyndrickxia acidicola]
MPSGKVFPYPYFEITPSFDVVGCSIAADLLFGQLSNFRDIVNEGSMKKAESLLKDVHHSKEVELVLKTVQAPFALFNCSVTWEKETGHLVCIQQDQRIKNLEGLVQKHHERLATTNFELLEKKEEVEKAYSKIKELSIPYITLTDRSALIPIYGELDHSLLKERSEELMSRVYESECDKIFFDFNAVSTVTERGISSFTKLVQMLTLMGNQIFIISIKPEHAVYINNYELEDKIIYESNLREVLKKRL